jgi:energy-coupling factor transporter ATP-binding protein EcfA2
MLITGIEIENYKSFYEPQSASFGPGFNVIIGPNNAGKTSLLNALKLDFTHQPHLSSRVSIPGSPSIVRLKVKINLDDVLRFMKVNGYQSLRFQSPQNDIPELAVGNWIALLENGWQSTITIRNPGGIEGVTDPIYGSGVHGPTAERMMNLNPSATGFVLDPGNVNHTQPHILEYPHQLLGFSRYVFRAERMNISTSPIGTSAVLAPDASNLPEVLHTLTGNPVLNRKYLDLVYRVLPDIKGITVLNRDTSQFEIRIWNEPFETERSDLAVLLSDCGTGVSQILAVLYVVVTSREPKTIIIDEPQSFLHPGALRKLLEILREYPQHQYILATHSPMLITNLELSSLTLVRREGTGTRLTTLQPKDPRELRLVLNEVGAQLSDVYGADQILWVEGATEAECFPLIARKLIGSLGGTVVLGVRNTGDFDTKDKKKADMVFDVYGRLGLSNAILPPAIGFIFDREHRSKSERQDFERRGEALNVPVHFLERTLYENYLLEPNAIAHVINQHDTRQERPLAKGDIEAWIEKHRWDSKYFKKVLDPARRESDQASGFTWWKSEVDGANFLKDIFKTLTENRVEFRKTTHSIELTEWILKHCPELFEEICTILMTCLPTV